MVPFGTILATALLALVATQNVNSDSCSDGVDADNVQVFSLLQSEMQMQVTRLMSIAQEHVVDDLPAVQTAGAATQGNKPAELLKMGTRFESVAKMTPAQDTIFAPLKWDKPQTRAELEHIEANASGDLPAFAAGAVVSLWGAMVCVIFFMAIRSYLPQIYSNNVALNPDLQIPDGRFGWAKAAWAADIPAVMQSAGLDQAMHLEFMMMALKILAVMGLPMLFIMGPVNAFFGGHNAGDDRLSFFSFGNIANGSPLYWIHAVVVWAVVLTVQWHIHAGQKHFLKYRFQWLAELPDIRAQTILVEGIPPEYQSDARLMDFFKIMFGSPAVISSYVVKKAPALETMCAQKNRIKKALSKAQFKNTKPDATPEDQELETTLIADLQQQEANIKKLRKEVKAASDTCVGSEGHNTSSGFVTFASRSEAVSALNVQYSEDCEEWEVSIPPEPSSILWGDLQQDYAQANGLTVLGYVLIGSLFLLYFPIALFITQIAVSIHLGPLQPLWQALAPTVGLFAMVSYLPTILHMIFQQYFTLKETAWSQQLLQKWLFIFQVAFVILVTAVGGSVTEFAKTVAQSPLEVFGLLGSTMPHATHFYMNYLAILWVSHAFQLTRLPILSKYVFFGRIFDDQTALEMAEPEDQDWHGIGARSVRITTNLCIAIIFGTLCPPILLVSFIDFLICRIVFGYLVLYAETRKPDLGGAFWVEQLRNLFVGNIIYCLMMTGVLAGRASSNGPAMIAGPSLLYVIWSMKKFERSYRWERLPFKELMESTKSPSKEDQGEYVQPMISGIDPTPLRPGLRKGGVLIDALSEKNRLVEFASARLL